MQTPTEASNATAAVIAPLATKQITPSLKCLLTKLRATNHNLSPLLRVQAGKKRPYARRRPDGSWGREHAEIGDCLRHHNGGGKLACRLLQLELCVLDYDGDDNTEVMTADTKKLKDWGVEFYNVPSAKHGRWHRYLICKEKIEKGRWKDDWNGDTIGGARSYIIMHQPERALEAILRLRETDSPITAAQLESLHPTTIEKKQLPLDQLVNAGKPDECVKGNRNNWVNREGHIAGLKQDEARREDVRQTAIAAGLPVDEVNKTVDRAYAEGLAKSNAPTPKNPNTPTAVTNSKNQPAWMLNPTEYRAKVGQLAGTGQFNPAKPPKDKPPLWFGATARGEMIMVSGPPSSGKSTFARVETIVNDVKAVWMLGKDQRAAKAVKKICDLLGLEEFPHHRIKVFELTDTLRSDLLKGAADEGRARIYVDLILKLKQQLGGLDVVINDNVLELLISVEGAYTDGELNLSSVKSITPAMQWLSDRARELDVLFYNIFQSTKASTGHQPHTLGLLGYHDIGYAIMRNTKRARLEFDRDEANMLKELFKDDSLARIVNIEKNRESEFEDQERGEGFYTWRINSGGNDLRRIEQEAPGSGDIGLDGMRERIRRWMSRGNKPRSQNDVERGVVGNNDLKRAAWKAMRDDDEVTYVGGTYMLFHGRDG